MSALRYIYGGCFVLILVVVVAGGYIVRDYIEQRVIRTMIHSVHQSFIADFAKEVWEPNRRVFNRLPCETKQCVDSGPIKQAFVNYFARSPFLFYRIYRNDETAKELFSGKTLADNYPDEYTREIFRQVSGGNTLSDVRYGVTLGKASYNIVRTFAPVIIYSPSASGSTRTPAILEVGYDLTPFWRNVNLVHWSVVIGVSVFFVIMFTTMILSSLHNEKILAKQHEKTTDLVAAKASAEAENKAKSQFLANISHELRTPLNAIIGFSQILKDEVMGPIQNAEYKQYINDIHTSGSHLLSLINDILDFSKLEADKLTVDMEDVDIRKLVNNSIRLVVPRAEEAGVELTSKMMKEHHIIATDAKRLKQVLLNILSNSVKFTDQGGKITVSSWHGVEDKKFYIEIEDTGVGIAPKDISKVFSSFGQAENKLSRRYEGTGLGLPLSKKLVELMHGELSLTSELGVGTKVLIKLPYERIGEISGENPANPADVATPSESKGEF